MNKKQSAFLELYEPIHDRFERFCRARVYGDMDFKDLMNDTLLKAYQKFDELRSKEAFLSFLFSISVRILANNKRKRKEDSDQFEKQEALVFDLSASTDTSTDVYFLHQALAQLSDDQRESIILFEISGFSIKEIAKIQETSESNVKQRLRRGRIRLKEILTFVALPNEANSNEKRKEGQL
jgi:RNA polymerase sigma-70 factor (ECF subfamily)